MRLDTERLIAHVREETPPALFLLAFCAVYMWQPIAGLLPTISDILDLYYPGYHWFSERLAAGAFPLVNPLVGAGIPTLAESQLGILQPFTAALVALLPARWAFPVVLITFHFLGAMGGYVLGRTLRFSRAPSTFLGLVAGFGGAWLTYHANPAIAATLFVYPWLLAVLEAACRSIRTKGPIQALSWTVPVGICVALLLLGGTVQIGGYAIAISGLFLVSRLVALPDTRERLAYGGSAVGGLLLGIGIAAILLIPAVDYASRAAPSLLSSADRMDWSLSKSVDPLILFSFLVPKAVHSGAIETAWNAPALWGGTPAAVLGVYGLTRMSRRLRYTVLGMVLVPLFFALGKNNAIYRALVDALPVLTTFRIPGRWLLVTNVPLGVAAAAGLQGIMDDQSRSIRNLAVSTLLIGGLGALGLLFIKDPFDTMVRWALPAIVFMILLVLLHRDLSGALARPRAQVLILGLLAVELAIVGMVTGGPYVDAHSFEEEPATVQAIEPGEHRIAHMTSSDAHEIVPVNRNLLWNVSSIDSKGPTTRPALLERFLQADPPPRTEGKLKAIAGVRYVLSEDRLNKSFLELIAARHDFRVYENREFTSMVELYSPDAATVVGEPAEAVALLSNETDPVDPTDEILISNAPGSLERRNVSEVSGSARLISWTEEGVEIHVDTDAPAYLFVSRLHNPGWQFSVDGEDVPVWVAQGAFMVVPVPEGESSVRGTYAPSHVDQGMKVSAASVGVAGALLLGSTLAGGRERDEA